MKSVYNFHQFLDHRSNVLTLWGVHDATVFLKYEIVKGLFSHFATTESGNPPVTYFDVLKIWRSKALQKSFPLSKTLLNHPSTPVTPVVSSIQDELPIVYVTSDRSLEQFDTNNKFSRFVPFENADERIGLKKFFGACAANKVQSLGMDPSERNSGLPTLLILDPKTHTLLKRNGVDDLMKDKSKAVSSWMKLKESS